MVEPHVLDRWREIISQCSSILERNVDHDYLDLCRRILTGGKQRKDRTGTGVIGTFGERLDIDLSKGFPLLTTKRVYWRGIVRELLWFISGSSDANVLKSQGVHIWDGHSSREYLNSRGFEHYPEGTIGPCYGWQWRSSGSCYTTERSLPRERRTGVDQLAQVIKALQEDPTDRRLVVSAWNPADIPLMALPPCHILYQFYVDVDDNTLSCQMYQRSCDVGLGLPFNIASYALLTHIVAHICGYKPGRLIMCLGDTHIYINHVEAIKSQTSRSVSSALPILKLSPDCPKDLDLIREEHIILENYDPQPAVLMLMSV